VDTGASFTAISDTDAYRNQIPYHDLRMDSYETYGITGTIRTRQLPNSEIYFLTDKKTNYRVQFPLLRIMDRGIYTNAIYNPRTSLLGIDVLHNFKISFQGDMVILEKDQAQTEIPSLPKIIPFKPNLPILLPPQPKRSILTPKKRTK